MEVCPVSSITCTRSMFKHTVVTSIFETPSISVASFTGGHYSSACITECNILWDIFCMCCCSYIVCHHSTLVIEHSLKVENASQTNCVANKFVSGLIVR